MDKKFLIITLLVIVSIIGGGILIVSKSSTPAVYSNIEEFAQCLSSKKITMYGAVWCSHCQAQKKLFGDSFKYVPYVECPDNPKICLDANVKSYPTWVFPDGKRLQGEQKLEDVSRLSGCSLNKSG